jgi:aryl-alcohol dehydrogenase-like predicted oxidoreductase
MSFVTSFSGPVGLGTMSMAINQNRPTVNEGRRVLNVLINDHGLTFLDTADCYCKGEDEFGYCERVLSQFTNLDTVLIATKVGIRREGVAWKVCGDPKYLRRACELSLRNLNDETIDLCQFHAPDPLVPISESLGELTRLKEEGKISHIGICNVSMDQLIEATAHFEIEAVQNPLSILFYQPAEHDAILRFCENRSIAYIAFAPFGGHQNAHQLPYASNELNVLASSEGLSVYQLSLLFLKSLSNEILAIPGSTALSHAVENLKTGTITPSHNLILKLSEIVSRETLDN